MDVFDTYFDHPADPELGRRAIIEHRDKRSSGVTYVTYEWNPDLPLDVQEKLLGRKLRRLDQKAARE